MFNQPLPVAEAIRSIRGGRGPDRRPDRPKARAGTTL